MRAFLQTLAAVVLLTWSGASWAADATDTPAPESNTAPTPAASPDEPPVPAPPKFTLRYKFQPGETIRWRVEHKSHIRTTISGTTQSAESVSISVKAWKVASVDDQGNVTFEHSVESVKMRQKLSGRQEVSYDSLADKTPPPVFEEAAKSVGVPLTVVTMDPLGKVIHREEKQPRPAGNEEAQLTISLPEAAVAIGEKWSFPNEVQVRTEDQGVKRIKIRQQYTLTDVKNGIALIHMETQVLTPLHDPKIEAQLVQRETTGDVRFDIEAGRLIRQQIDLEKSVLRFAGDQSSLDCLTRFEETLLTDSPPTANADHDASEGETSQE